MYGTNFMDLIGRFNDLPVGSKAGRKWKEANCFIRAIILIRMGGGERFLEQRLIYRFPVPIKPTFPRVGTFQRCKIPDKSVFR